MKYPWKNLIFEGGSVKGIAYAGALQILDQKGILNQIQRVGGASAGAINAVLLALKFSSQEITKILQEMDFTNFMDDSWGIIRDTERLLTEFGWYKGDFFQEWIEGLIEQKPGMVKLT